MEVRDSAAAPNLLWTVYQPDGELSHLVVLPKSATGLAADALNCSHLDGRVRVTKNLRLFELARVVVRLDHRASFIVNANHSPHSLRFVSLNGIVRSTLPLESRMRISPERNDARSSA